MQASFRANVGLLLAGLGAFVLMGAGQSLYGPALPVFARGFGIGVGSAGLLISAHWVGTGVGVLAMFGLSRWITPRAALGVMAAGAAGVALGSAFGPGIGFGLTMTAAVVFGAGYGASTVIYNRRFMQVFGAQGPSMLSLLNAMFGIGAICGPLIFIAADSRIGPTYGAVAVVAALAVAAAGRPRRLVPVAEMRSGFRFDAAILGFGLVAVGVEATLIGLGPTALIALGQTEDHAAQLLSVFFVAFLTVRLSMVALTALVPAFTLFTAALILACVSAFAAMLTGSAVFFVAMGVAAGMFFPTFYVTASRRMGDDDRVAPLIILAGLIGGIVAPVATGAVMARYGDVSFFAAIGVEMGLASLLALAALRRMNLR